MQKVEGSNPFSRSQKGLHLQGFFMCAVGLCVCVWSDSLRTRRGPIVGRSKKNALFAGRLVRPNRSPPAGLQKVECSPAAALGRLFLQMARFAQGRLPARCQRSRSLGRESDFSPDSGGRPLASDPGEPWPPTPRALRRTASGQRRGQPGPLAAKAFVTAASSSSVRRRENVSVRCELGRARAIVRMSASGR